MKTKPHIRTIKSNPDEGRIDLRGSKDTLVSHKNNKSAKSSPEYDERNIQRHARKSVKGVREDNRYKKTATFLKPFCLSDYAECFNESSFHSILVCPNDKYCDRWYPEDKLKEFIRFLKESIVDNKHCIRRCSIEKYTQCVCNEIDKFAGEKLK